MTKKTYLYDLLLTIFRIKFKNIFYGMSESKHKTVKVNGYDILHHLIMNGADTIPNIAKIMDTSIPTITKMLNDLAKEEYVIMQGKNEGFEGRPAMRYAVNPEYGFFIGVEIKQDEARIGIVDFDGNIIAMKDIPYITKNTGEGLKDLCRIIKDFIKETKINVTRIISLQINIAGRVNTLSGTSHTIYSFLQEPLAEYLEQELSYPVTIENDTRSMFYGEIYKGGIQGLKDVIYINISWGIGCAIMCNGKIISGNSGFAGELGHCFAFENGRLCHCGKTGCLETEVSGSALHRMCIENIEKGKKSILEERFFIDLQEIKLLDIMQAIKEEDVLCIELIEHIANNLGIQIANLINLLNPETIIIGGTLSRAGDYMMLPLRTAINKHTLKLVNSDAHVIFSNLKEEAGIIGACYLARDNYLKSQFNH